MNGGIGGARSNIHFSACDWRDLPASAFNFSEQFDAPERVPHWPKEESDAVYLFGCEAIRALGLDPRMCRKRSVTTTSGETVPPECLEAVFCLKTNACFYLNSRYADKYPQLHAKKTEPGCCEPRGFACDWKGSLYRLFF